MVRPHTRLCSQWATLISSLVCFSLGPALYAQTDETKSEEPQEKVEAEAEANVADDDTPLLSTEQRAALQEAAEARRRDDVPVPIPVAPAYDEVGTAASAEMKAAGDLARDSGAAALLRSRAAINLQEAIEEYLENHVNHVKAYHAKRAAWREARELERRDPVTPEQAQKIAESRTPDRLSPDYFNPETGEILWPPVLDAEPLEPMRQAIEEQFERRASPGDAWNLENVQWVKANAEAMQKAVDTVKADIPLQTYVSISQMLESLAWEAEHNAEGKRVKITAPAETDVSPAGTDASPAEPDASP